MEAIKLSKKDRKLNKAIKNNNTRVQNFFEIAEIKEDHILTTRNEEKYFLEVKPKNITVLSKPISFLNCLNLKFCVLIIHKTMKIT